MTAPSDCFTSHADHEILKKIKRSCVLCSTPRTGSTLLAKSMYRTRSLGHPGEYCNSVNTGAIKTAADLSNYFLEIKKTTTPNGIFSMKIHWNQLSQVAQQTGKLRQTPLTATQWMLEYIPAPHYIFIRRRDKVRQAVSLLFSHETKVWDAPAGQPPPPVPKSISYQRKKINYLIRRIEAEERC